MSVREPVKSSKSSQTHSLLARHFHSRGGVSRAVTFDCWGTLLFLEDPLAVYSERVDALHRSVRAEGIESPADVIRAALDDAWQLHWNCWVAGISSGPEEIARWALSTLRVRSEDATRRLATDFAELALESDVRVLETAPFTLERLARAEVRRGLICDTGFAPGYIVRSLLKREGMLDLLEVQIFSDEMKAPKPDARLFQAALSLIDAVPGSSVHVGDLRRTDIAGARAVGMGTVRIRDQHDDRSDHPEADVVADSHAHLREILGVDGD